MARSKLKHGRSARPRLTLSQILHWADEWFQQNREWPHFNSGWIPGTDEKWSNINHCLILGRRGLRGGTSLRELLAKHRSIRSFKRRPVLTESLILQWADAHHAHYGKWPNRLSGQIARTRDETWSGIYDALCTGTRGLPGGSTLAKFLREHRGVLTHLDAPRLTVEQILSWADAHRVRTGDWPKAPSGCIPGTKDSWWSINSSLVYGLRGLPGGTTLAKLLAERRGARSRGHLPVLTEKLILKWADNHHRRHGKWPTYLSGDIAGTQETWVVVDRSLRTGTRGLTVVSSLARLLRKHRGVLSHLDVPRWTEEEILSWIDAHHDRTGDWPKMNLVEIPESPGTTWFRVSKALSRGQRGLSGGSSLRNFLAEHRGVKSPKASECGK